MTSVSTHDHGTFTLAAKPRELTPLDPATVRLSVLIPVYNERNTIETILDRVHATPIRKEIICVDDCSTDGTRERLVELHAAGYIDQLILQPAERREGQGDPHGARRQHGRRSSSCRTPTSSTTRRTGPCCSSRSSTARRTRASARASSAGRTACSTTGTRSGNTLLTLFSNMLTNLNLTDMETCYKAVRGDLARSLRAHVGPVRLRAGDHGAARASATRASTRCRSRYAGRTYAEGKKINWKDGVAAFWHILKFNLLA